MLDIKQQVQSKLLQPGARPNQVRECGTAFRSRFCRD